MIDELIRQLQDPDPETRRNAIRALGRSKNPAALKPLAAIVQSDPDPELREYARKAGQYIRQQTQRQTRPRIEPFEKAEAHVEPDADELSPMQRYQKLLESERQVIEQRQREQERENTTIRPLHEDDVASTEPPGPRTASGVLLVRGRQYNVTKIDQDRAKQYVDAALSLNIGGDNARAMKSLTDAISLNPNLINDSYFNNIATVVTGLDGDAALQMIVDRNERKRFTDSAVRERKDRRVEEHMSEARQATWTDVTFELVVYSLIVIIGPVLAVLVTSESAKSLVANFDQISSELPEQLQGAQAVFTNMSLGGLLPIGIVSGISGVLSLLLQTVLIHFSATWLGGTGTWRHLIRVLIGFYNKWLPVLFFILYITIAFAFISAFSPVILCLVLVLVGLSLYVSFKTSGKIGEAYDFGAGKGCLALVISFLVIGLINAVIGFLLGQALGAAFGQLSVG